MNKKIKKFFYVYKLEHVETKEFYFGSRTCNCLPELDIKYLGSMITWKPDKTKLIKTIIKKDFNTYNQLIRYESNIIKKHINNSLNRNYNIPTLKYHTFGMHVVIDNNGNNIMVPINDQRYLSGELVSIHKNKLSIIKPDGTTGQCDINDPLWLNGTYIAISKNKVSIIKPDGTTGQCDINDPLYLSGKLISIHKNTLNVIKPDGTTGRVSLDDPLWLNGTYKSTSINTVNVVKPDGTTCQVSLDDPLWLNGTYIALTKNKLSIIKPDGTTGQCDINDPLWLNGTYKMICKNKVTAKFANDYNKTLQVDINDIRLKTGELVGINKGVLTWSKNITINNITCSAKYWSDFYKIKLKDLIKHFDEKNIIYFFK